MFADKTIEIGIPSRKLHERVAARACTHAFAITPNYWLLWEVSGAMPSAVLCRGGERISEVASNRVDVGAGCPQAAAPSLEKVSCSGP